MNQAADSEKSSASPQSPTPDYRRYSNLVRASLLAILVDLALILFKYTLAGFSGNDVLLADALHSGGDLAVSLTVLISVIVHHSFHDSPAAKRFEAVAALIISIALIFGAIRMLNEVWQNKAFSSAFTAGPSPTLVITLAGVSVIMVVTLMMANYKKEVGRTNDSIAFKAEGLHTYSDFLTSLGVWLTLFIAYFDVQIGRFTSFIIALAVLQIGLKLFIGSVRALPIGFKVPGRISILVPPGFKANVKKQSGRVVGSLAEVNRITSTTLQYPAIWIVRNKGRILPTHVILLALLYIGTGFYQVRPYQTGLEVFLGRVEGQRTPGLHYHLPRPFGDVVLVDTGVPIRLESGFRTRVTPLSKEPAVYLWEYSHQQGRYLKVLDEALAITGDENLVDANFLCYYRITDPLQYALGNKDSHEILRSLLVQQARMVLARYRLDDLLAADRSTVQEELLGELKSAVAGFPLGVEIKNVYMQEAHPPIEVIPQYRAVGSAREKRDYIVQKAEAYANTLIPRTKGKASIITLNADAAAKTTLLKSEGESRRFLLNQSLFDRHKETHKQRLWWDLIEKTLARRPLYVLPSQTKRRITIDRSDPGEIRE